MIQSEKLLDTQYTLTVSTTPSAATCTLTYNGTSYTAKTLTVPVGSTISYSVYHSTYGTTYGTITMNSNKTLTCTGASSTSYTDVSWSRPNLSSGGTLGGSSFAVSASGVYQSQYAIYKAVDGNTSTQWDANRATGSYYIFYNPTPLKVTGLNMNQWTGDDYKHWSIAGTVSASNNGSSWTSVGSYSQNAKVISISLSNSNYYKYYKITSSSYASGTRWGILELGITAYYQTSSTTYYWNKTVT